MGNMSSRDPQTEDFDSNWVDRFEEFMNGGGCKESFNTFLECAEEAEKKKGNVGNCKCYPMLLSCMEEHYDYYKPFFEAKKITEVEIDKEVNAFLGTKEGGDSTEEYFAFMEGGGCKESSMAWEYCKEEAEKKKESSAKCAEGFSILVKCMEARSDYYQPYLALKESANVMMIKELDALLKKN